MPVQRGGYLDRRYHAALDWYWDRAYPVVEAEAAPEVVVTLPPGRAVWPELPILSHRHLFPVPSHWPNLALGAPPPLVGEVVVKPPGAMVFPERVRGRVALQPMPTGWVNMALSFPLGPPQPAPTGPPKGGLPLMGVGR